MRIELPEVSEQEIANEAELLNAILDYPDIFLRISEILGSSAFYDPVHASTFAAIQHLHSHSIDITPANAVACARQLAPNLTPFQVADSRTYISADHTVRLAEQVSGASIRREALNAASKALKAVSDSPVAWASGDAAEVRTGLLRACELLESGATVRQEVKSLADVAAKVARRIDTAYQIEHHPETLAPGDSTLIVPTGLDTLDAWHRGGLHAGRIYTVGARPGVGKTAFVLQVAAHAAANGHPALVFSLEMGATELGERLAANLTGMTTADMIESHLALDDGKRRIAEVSDRPLYFCDTEGLTPSSVRNVVRAQVRKHNVQLVVVDYLQILKPDHEHRSLPRYLQIKAAIEELKHEARASRVPFLIAAQLGRAATDAHVPCLQHFREGGDIENTTDAGWLLWDMDDNRDDNDRRFHGPEFANVGVNVDKNRQGRTGVVDTSFDKPRSRFTDNGELDYGKLEPKKKSTSAAF